MALICVCGEPNTVNHALICKRGGYVIRRHNKLRDIEAELIYEVHATLWRRNLNSFLCQGSTFVGTT